MQERQTVYGARIRCVKTGKVEWRDGVQVMDRLSGKVTRLLMALRQHEPQDAPRSFEFLHAELRRLGEHHEHTPQANALVHDAYLCLVDARQGWRNRTHFFVIASSAMRGILLDQVRAKHSFSSRRVNLKKVTLLARQHYDDILALDHALHSLSKISPRQERIVELRYFDGLSAQEPEEALGISSVTVPREGAVAKAWLRGELAGRAATP